MRSKELHLIVTFHTTTEAMAFEKYCKAMNIPGRLIPVPVMITAGCGLAWMVNPMHKEEISALMEKFSLEIDTFYEIEV